MSTPLKMAELVEGLEVLVRDHSRARRLLKVLRERLPNDGGAWDEIRAEINGILRDMK